MGKIEGIFATNISGKVGNVVFRKNGKQNIVSQRPASVKNPRTDMQQRQRAYIKTVSSAYSVLKPICDHSFEGVAYGADSMNFFKKENYKIVSNAGRAVLKNSSDVVVPLPLKISSGSISWAGYKDLKGNGILELGDISSFLTENKITDLTKLQPKQFMNMLGLELGDQITILKLIEFDSISTEYAIQYRSELVYSRYIINVDRASSVRPFLVRHEDKYGRNYYTIDPLYISLDSIVEEKCQLVILEDKIIIGDENVMSADFDGLGAVIISRKSGKSWLRSTEYLAAPNSYYEGSDATYEIDNVLPSYRPTGERYLNNAER